jgi:hypothetical protein
MQRAALVLAILWVLHLTTAQAYVGPGVGAGTLAVVMGILSSIFFAFVGILWYPIKRLLKLMKKRPSAPQPSADSQEGQESGSEAR